MNNFLYTYSFLISIILNINCLSGQNINDQRQDFLKTSIVFPVSPEASAMGKYGAVPVNLASGKINYQVPLFSIKLKDFEWPVYLSYNYGGLLTENDPGLTGLGWDLIANGRITRKINGVPDELDNRDFYKSEVIPYLKGDLDQLSVERKKDKVANLYILLSETNGADGQPDEYFLNVSNLNASFVYNHLEEVIFNSHKLLKVEGIKVTDNNGINYTFGVNEMADYTNDNDHFEEIISSRLLTKIELPNNGGVITLEYHNRSTDHNYSKRIFSEIETTGDTYKFNSAERVTNIYPIILKKITFPGGYIRFYSHEFMINDDGFISGGHSLEKVTLFNNISSDSISYKFQYDNKNKFKKLLKNIEKISQGIRIPYYSFKYFNEKDIPDHLHYSEQDSLGYYNGDLNVSLSKSSRSMNFEKTRYGALKKINYPTGGYSEIEYEPNSISTIGVSGGLRSRTNHFFPGIRVKTTTENDGLHRVTSFNYEYLLEDEKSSSGSYVGGNPIYTHKTFTKKYDRGAYANQVVEEVHKNAKSYVPFSSFYGSPVLYERVTITKNNGNAGKIVKHFSKAYDDNFPFPFKPSLKKDWQKGKLKLLETFVWEDGRFIKISSDTYNYSNIFPYGKDENSTKIAYGLVVGQKKFTYITANEFDKGYAGDYIEDQYFICPKIQILKSTSHTKYDSSGNILLNYYSLFNYDQPHYKLKKITKSSSISNQVLVNTYTYPNDKPDHPLTSQNRIAVPIETRSYLKRSATDSLLVSHQKTIYKSDNDLIVPHKIQSTTGSHTLEDRRLYDYYDDFGNPTQYHVPQGRFTTLLWGYSGQYVIAKIENATLAQVKNALGNPSSVDQNQLTAIDALRGNNPEWMITTYDHLPLVGVKKITQPNGQVTHYQYDDFNRLKYIKDKDRKLLEEYHYHYALKD